VPNVERYGPGEEAIDFNPGDFILTHRFRPIAALIKVGQEMRFRGDESVYAHWTHCALVVANDGALVEAESVGVTRSPISKYQSKEYHLVRLGAEFTSEGRQRAVAYASSQVGQGFGYLALLGSALFLVLGLHLKLMRRNHQICSSLVVRALEAGGMLRDADPDLTLPAHLAKIYDIRP
jgi:uncharacterized protein YycO